MEMKKKNKKKIIMIVIIKLRLPVGLPVRECYMWFNKKSSYMFLKRASPTLNTK